MLQSWIHKNIFSESEHLDQLEGGFIIKQCMSKLPNFFLKVVVSKFITTIALYLKNVSRYDYCKPISNKIHTGQTNSLYLQSSSPNFLRRYEDQWQYISYQNNCLQDMFIKIMILS